jgi:predicted nucleotidyltransferase
MASSVPPINQQTKSMLTDLKAIVDRLDVPMLLIGAMARVLVFDSQYGEGRATKDWDIAVKMDDWKRYQALVEQMTTSKPARFKNTSVVHKFIHVSTNLEVDIIPFGGISNDRQEIIWADGNQMSVLGLQEAFSNARVENVEGIEIRSLDYPAFVGLKLLAWNEREENKDLQDIAQVLQNYQDDEQIGVLYPAIEQEQIDYDSAASALIGREIQTVFQAEALAKIREVVSELIENQDKHLSPFVRAAPDRADWDAEFERLVNRFKALQYGLQEPLDNI